MNGAAPSSVFGCHWCFSSHCLMFLFLLLLQLFGVPDFVLWLAYPAAVDIFCPLKLCRCLSAYTYRKHDSLQLGMHHSASAPDPHNKPGNGEQSQFMAGRWLQYFAPNPTVGSEMFNTDALVGSGHANGQQIFFN